MAQLTKEQIRDWLAERGRDRQWLADACGVSRGTVDQWFAERGFSDLALAVVRALMQVDELSEALRSQEKQPDETALIEFNTAEFEVIEAARAKVGTPTRPEFYHDAIMRYAQELKAADPTLDDEPTDGDADAPDSDQHMEAAARAFLKERGQVPRSQAVKPVPGSVRGQSQKDSASPGK